MVSLPSRPQTRRSAEALRALEDGLLEARGEALTRDDRRVLRAGVEETLARFPGIALTAEHGRMLAALLPPREPPHVTLAERNTADLFLTLAVRAGDGK